MKSECGAVSSSIALHRYGVNVPGVRMVDAPAGVLGLEWIDGKSVRFLLGGGAEGVEEVVGESEENEDEEFIEEDPLREYGISQGTISCTSS